MVAPTQFATETHAATDEDAELGPVPAATKKARATETAEIPATTNHRRVLVRMPSQMKTNQLAKPQLAMASTTSGHHRRRFVDGESSELLAPKSDTDAASAWSRTFGSRSSSGLRRATAGNG